MFFIVPCPNLTQPDNGVINCSLGDDAVPSYEDTCSFTCNTGYELTGNDISICQSDGSWSGSDSVCSGGILLLLLIHNRKHVCREIATNPRKNHRYLMHLSA